jgi:hypothetical protein
MAGITTSPLIRHLRGTPIMHVRHVRRGTCAAAGTCTREVCLAARVLRLVA